MCELFQEVQRSPLPKYPLSAAVTGTLNACSIWEAQTGHGAALVF